MGRQKTLPREGVHAREGRPPLYEHSRGWNCARVATGVMIGTVSRSAWEKLNDFMGLTDSLVNSIPSWIRFGCRLGVREYA